MACSLGAGLTGLAKQYRDRRKSRLFGPIVVMALGAALLLVALAVFLLHRFDAAAAEREQHMVENGLERQLHEFDAVIVPQVNWDDAVKKLDHQFDPAWADFNVGNYLYTFNGFTRTFIVDGEGKPFYASIDGVRVGTEHFARFSAIAAQLLPQIRKAEAERPPIKPRPGKDNILTEPIQANGFAKVDGQVYLVVATLVQPDFGRILPRHARAPVTFTALPFDAAMLKAFSERYLLDRLELVAPGRSAQGGAQVALLSPKGQALALLTWQPREPGTMLLDQLRLPMLGVLALIAFTAFTIVRRGSRVLNELFASEARARELALHDTLTGLPNRAKLFERLGTLLGQIDGRGRAVAVLCVDLDRFKDVNDTLGHGAGDVLIEQVAERLRRVCAEAALISRLGGDEFVVVCDKSSREWVEAMGLRILTAVREPVASAYGKIEASCSIGMAIIDDAGVAPGEALRRADLALYRSKELGRMQASFFVPAMDNALRERRALEADLRLGLSRDQLEMVYQPQVDEAGRVIAYEALVRWNHPERGVIPPAVFVPLAEECGLIQPLGEFVLRRVFAETAAWKDKRIAINVSPLQIRLPGFVALVTRLAAGAGADPARYEIELTETALLADGPVTAANFTALKRLGLTIALDDFGTGYSSLSVLQRFPVDKIKIDRAFVGCMEESAESEALVEAIIKLADALDLAVIAEGVETEEQMARLGALGCHEFQGHLTGLPISAAAIEAARLSARRIRRRA